MLKGEYLLIKKSFLVEYAKHRIACRKSSESADYKDFLANRFNSALETSANIYDFDGVNANIEIAGPLSPEGPDAWDLFDGIGGCSYNNIVKAAEKAARDVDPVTGEVFIDMNTPGGTVDGCDKAFQALWVLSLTHKITVRNHGLICSAGMWLAAAGHSIVATTPAALQGSIGVVIHTFDFSGMLEEFGIKEIVITNFESPDKVPDLSTEKGQEIIIEELNDIFGVFSGRVLQGRNRTSKKITQAIINNLKGRVVIASKAVSLGLADAIVEKADSSKGSTLLSNNDKTVTQSIFAPKIIITKKHNEKESKREGKKMKLSDLLDEHPEVKKEYQDALSATRAEGVESVRTAAKTAMPILTSADYPAAIKEVAAKVVIGEVDVIALTSAVSAFDAVKEQVASAAAQKEPVIETPADSAVIASGGDGKVVDQQSYQDNVSALKKAQGIK